MMQQTAATTQRLLQLAREQGGLRARDLAQYGIARECLTRQTRAGLLLRIGRGLYMLPNTDITEFHSLVESAKRLPDGIVCLLSALRFHNLTTQAPFEVWLALPPTSRTPHVDYPPLHIARFFGSALAEGVRSSSIHMWCD